MSVGVGGVGLAWGEGWGEGWDGEWGRDDGVVQGWVSGRCLDQRAYTATPNGADMLSERTGQRGITRTTLDTSSRSETETRSKTKARTHAGRRVRARTTTRHALLRYVCYAQG